MDKDAQKKVKVDGYRWGNSERQWNWKLSQQESINGWIQKKTESESDCFVNATRNDYRIMLGEIGR